MDELHGISTEITSSLLEFDGSTELKLDLQVIYLRRVHNFCFYAGKWCKDEWTLRDRCGVATVRESCTGATEGIWALDHEKRIKERDISKLCHAKLSLTH